MRVAIFSDVHGNSIALDAVLADIAAQGDIDAYWLLGDYAAIGPDPVGCLERIAALPNASFTRGNTDRYLIESLTPGLDVEAVIQDPALLKRVFETHTSFGWTLGAVATAGWLDWLKALPLEHRVTLPDGTRFLGVHASPGSDDSWGLHPEHNKDALHELFGHAEADLVCVGHTHWPMETWLGDIHLVNLGSVSNPFPPDLRASYVLLEADKDGLELNHCFVDYDHAAVIEACHQVQHPDKDYVNGFMRGNNKAGWMG